MPTVYQSAGSGRQPVRAPVENPKLGVRFVIARYGYPGALTPHRIVIYENIGLLAPDRCLTLSDPMNIKAARSSVYYENAIQRTQRLWDHRRPAVFMLSTYRAFPGFCSPVVPVYPRRTSRRCSGSRWQNTQAFVFPTLLVSASHMCSFINLNVLVSLQRHRARTWP